MTEAVLAPEHVTTADALWRQLQAAHHILLPTHVNVDGDSLGSTIGLARALRAIGRAAHVVLSDGQAPHLLTYLARDEPLLAGTATLPTTDLVCLVDITGPGRLGPLQMVLGDDCIAAGLVIDHHVSNERFGAVNLVDPTAASTAELIYLLLRRWGLPVTADVAAPLLSGVLSDTLSFQTTATTPRTLRVAADLVEAGAPLAAIVERLFRAKPYSTARLFGAVVATSRLEDGLLWAEITPAMLAAAGARASETEGVIMYLAGVEEAIVFALLYEQEGGWRASLRSNSDAVDVSILAGRYGGGGHRRAAGCTLSGGPRVRDAFLADLKVAIAASQPA
ncbi:MAG: DHH family phosphoesterase [Chloroflexi bacterium]|nr:DHH family phosphoesterase [Chloroflexota bacterium]